MPAINVGGVALACLAAAPLAGQARHFRLLDARDGLASPVVTALAQDRDGLMWIGTSGGLFRYDGTRFERWAPDRLDTWVATITASKSGDVVVIDEKSGAVLQLGSDGARDVFGPNGPLRGAKAAVFDGSGALWVSVGASIIRRDTTNRWHVVSLDSSDATSPRILVAMGDEEILVPTRKAVWRAHARAPARRLANISNLVNGLKLPDGRILGITFSGELVEFGDRVTVRPSLFRGRGIALAERNGVIWASYDRSLAAVGPDSGFERLGAKEGISGGGPLLVDHEGSLWMGSWQGLFQFPEPDTRVWREGQGLVSDHVRSVSPFGEAILVDTWQGSVALARTSQGWTSTRLQPNGTGYFHGIDRSGAAWTGSPRGIIRRMHGRVSVPWRRETYLTRLAQAPSGAVYLATNRGLLVAETPNANLKAVVGLPLSSDSAVLDLAMIDLSGHLWIAGEGRVCSREAFASAAMRLARSDWWCATLPAEVPVYSMVQTPSGAIWVFLNRLGVWRLSRAGWERIPGSLTLPTSHSAYLVASPTGGFWVLAPGSVLRVVEDTTHTAGWRVVERLTEWHGVPHTAVSHIHETRDGTLWIATMLGLVRVPASVRRENLMPPRVVLAEGSVDNERVRFDTDLRLPYERNRLRLRFTAVSYRDPLTLRYQVRAQQSDPWESVVGTPEFRWVDLKAGRYRAEVRASLDGIEWSKEPAAFAFRVLSPWYRSVWALLLFATVLAALAVYMHRARVAVHVELERQRMRIAMDLHDELGSGLGSIGILAGVLRNAPRGPDAQPDRVADEIGSTAASLGAALTDIVWALDHGSGGLDAVAARLAEHGNRLFANGVSFNTTVPAIWPAARLDLAARRNALLIGVEALHNAARHAHASRVDLSLAPAANGWMLEIADDGIGLPSDASARGGVGLGSMRRRAHEIGANIQWLPRSGGGTIVRLEVNASRSRAFVRRIRRGRGSTLA